MMIKRMRGRSVTNILKMEADDDIGIVPLSQLVESVVPKAVSLIKGGAPERSVERIDRFLGLLRKNEIFQKVTQQKVVRLLELKDQQRENVMDEANDWLLKVSLYSQKLKEGSTYQSSVWHHLQDVICPVLAVIISHLDCNRNLDVMYSGDIWKKDLFLKVYRDLDFDEDVSESNSEEVSLKKHSSKEYPVKIGFFWVILKQLRHFATSSNGDEITDVSSILASLREAFEQGKEKVLKEFIFDLVNSTRDVKKTQLPLLIKWIISNCLPRIVDERRTLSPLEVLSIYQSMQESINWFLQITDIFPRVLTAVRDEVDKDVKLESPLCQLALKTAMKDLTPVFESFYVLQERNKWIQQVNQLESITQQMRNMYQEDEDDIIWKEWTRVMMFKLFVHHVLSQDVTPELNQIVCKKIKSVWGALKDPNMKKYKSFKLFIALYISLSNS